MQREYFTSHEEMRKHLLEGGKVVSVYWDDANYIWLNDKLQFVDESGDSYEGGCFIYKPSLYYKLEPQPKTIEWAEVPDYIRRGAHLRPKIMQENLYVFEGADGSWSIASTTTKGYYTAFSMYTPYSAVEWIVVKEPTQE